MALQVGRRLPHQLGFLFELPEGVVAPHAQQPTDGARVVAAAGTVASGKEKFLETTSKYIASHPLQSLGLAIAAGYLLSRLTR